MTDKYQLITSIETVSTGNIVSENIDGIKLLIKSSQTDIKNKTSHSFLDYYEINNKTNEISKTSTFPIQCDDMKVIIPSPTGKKRTQREGNIVI